MKSLFNAMNEKNNSALVRKPSSAVEKAASRTKRILSGMVADTLALTMKDAESLYQKTTSDITIISLDQNVISLLETTANVPPAWSEIKSLLIAGVKAGKLVCPIPHEIVWESSALSEKRYKRFKELQSYLSCGISFKSFSRLLGEEVLALVRPGSSLTSYESINWYDQADRVVGSIREKFFEIRASVKKQFDSLTTDFRNKDLSLEKLTKFIEAKNKHDLYDNLERLRSRQPLQAACSDTLEVCEFLSKNKISNEEIESLKKLVMEHKYESIPIFFYHNRLLVQFEYQLLQGGRRQKPGDPNDLTRAATALWASQMFVCDAELAEACKKAKISELQSKPTIILSAQQPPLFLKHLESILQASSGNE